MMLDTHHTLPGEVLPVQLKFLIPYHKFQSVNRTYIFVCLVEVIVTLLCYLLTLYNIACYTVNYQRKIVIYHIETLLFRISQHIPLFVRIKLFVVVTR